MENFFYINIYFLGKKERNKLNIEAMKFNHINYFLYLHPLFFFGGGGVRN